MRIIQWCLLLLVLVGCREQAATSPDVAEPQQDELTSKLVLTALKIGKADAFIFEVDGHTVLIKKREYNN